MSKKKSGTQKAAEQRSLEDQQRMQRMQDTAQGTLGQFEGPVEQSPFYKALLTTGIENTSRAYDRARADTRARSAQAGFGYAQPVAQGAENQLDAAEASSLAAVPREAMVSATEPALRAAGETAGMGGTAGQQGLGYMTGAAVPLEQQRQKSRFGLWKNLAGVGLLAAAPFTGGATLPYAGAMLGSGSSGGGGGE